MFDLVFLFTGLCGFALDPPPSARIRTAEGLDVVLVRAPEHVAMLVVHKDAVHEASTLRPSTCYHRDYYGYTLDQRIVRLRNRSASGEAHVTWDPLDGEPECPDRDNARSYGWVMPMSRVTPGEGQVLDQFRQPPRTLPRQVRAVIQLESGYLSTLEFARDKGDKDGKVIRWQFARGFPQSAIKTALGDPVELRQQGWKDPVELEFVDVSTRRTDLLILKVAGDGETRLAEIFNVPEKDVCCLPSPPGDIEQNDHFLHLYDLLPSDAVRSVPKVVKATPCPDLPWNAPVTGSCAKECFPAYSNPQCPGADMSRP